MDRETLHGFLKWLWPAIGAGIVGVAGVAIGAAQVWESAKQWVAVRYLSLSAMMDNPWSWVAAGAVFLVWLWAFVGSGRRAPSPVEREREGPQTGDSNKPQPPVAVRTDYTHRMDGAAYFMDLSVTALDRTSGLTVLVRYARAIHYLSRAEWKWTLPRRAVEQAELLKGEALVVNIASRTHRPAPDDLRVFGETIQHDDGNGGGTLVLTEVSIHAPNRLSVVCRRLYNFMIEPHGRGANVLDQEAHSFIVDPG